ncbi:MAG TPA: NAD-dependent epimerase/dehydratase family protein [Actinomycetota bacterium]|nr:NAD-dependent epimerase/dehydratase family protein [Actinomycetota bacterium]
MRVMVLGGTRFIGAAIVEELHDHGHEQLLVHRGEHEPDGAGRLADHLHADRRDLPHLRGAVADFDPEALVDTGAMSAADAEAALAAVGDGTRLLVLSSMDVYRAFGAMLAGTETDALPLDETSPVRPERYPYRGHPRLGGEAWLQEYEKLDVEAAYLAREATVCRLPMVYGERDYQRREEPILRRVRAGRDRVPVGAGTWLFTRGYVRDVAAGVRLALESDAAVAEVLNLGETRTWTMGLWATHVLEAAGSAAELTRVPDVLLPDDLQALGSTPQHLLVDSSKARDLLGWTETDPHEALHRSVAWHLANPPADASGDFTADDRALAAAG